MKKVIIFCITLVVLVSCKFGENTKNGNEAEENFTVSHELRTIQGTIVGEKKKKIAYAAIKLYLDEGDCMSAYTDTEGTFQFKVDELRIKDQSHFEIVYKGYAENLLSIRNYDDSKPIVLSKKGKVIPAAEYHVFYESIKSCAQ
ncbi:hypothetical protein [Aquimarina sp. 2304DJ70-9]|uniref:hypothetical protein n=1 Tax=Aquimarina penaris TaxID=3231044 RepID=UPI003462F352